MQRNVTNLLMGKRVYFKLIYLIIFWYTDTTTEKVVLQILEYLYVNHHYMVPNEMEGYRRMGW